MKTRLFVLLALLGVVLLGGCGFQAPPVVELQAVLLVTTAPDSLTAVLDGTRSTGSAPLLYDWIFGDGTATEDGGATVAHTFPAPGKYVVALTVSERQGPPPRPTRGPRWSTATAIVAVGQTPSVRFGWRITDERARERLVFTCNEQINLEAWAEGVPGVLFRWIVRGLNLVHQFDVFGSQVSIFLPCPVGAGCPLKCPDPYRFAVTLWVLPEAGEPISVSAELTVHAPRCLPL